MKCRHTKLYPHGSKKALKTDLSINLNILLDMRSQRMCDLELLIAKPDWTQAQAAKELRIAQFRVSDLVRGKWDKFSLAMLIELATRAGCKVSLEMV